VGRDAGLVAAYVRAKHGTWGYAGKWFSETAVLIEDENIIKEARESGYCEVTDSEPASKAEPTADSGVFSTADAKEVVKDEKPAEKPAPAPKAAKKAPAKKAEKAE
jgi:hypothetical protein